MDRIWAPWRKCYVTSDKKGGCIFCLERKSKLEDKKRYILKRSGRSFSMLNKYPYNTAHVMVAPYRHVKSLELLKRTELMDLMELVNYTKKKIDKRFKPDGYNIGLNIGKIAGAGFPSHVHVHIVPRWAGDTNFMPILSDTKVVSHSLEEVYNLLKG
ncbi:MAG: HIT domain-containing protein [Candidatus Omnitrophica bacterium]|nr:HIT domain-containing protein [Candidatus Omnitrophota bacterium]